MAGSKGAIDLVVQQQALDQIEKLNKGLREAVVNITEVSKLARANKDAFQGTDNRTKSNKKLSEMEKILKRLLIVEEKLKVVDSEENIVLQKQTALLNKRNAEHRKGVKTTKELARESENLNKKMEKNNKSAKTGVSRFKRFFKTLVAFDLARRGVQLFYDAISKGFQALKDLESISLQFKYLVNDAREAAITQGFLANQSEKLGVNLVDLSKSYLAFRKSAELANLSANDSRIVFGEVTKAASLLGKSDAEIRNVQVALEQMLSKGTVQAEELKKQLGNVLPGSFEIMAKAVQTLNPDLDVTNQEFGKMLKRGEIIAADVLPQFARELTKAYGVENVNRIETMSTATIRLDNAFISLVDNMNKGVSGLSLGITTVINALTQTVEGLGLSFLSLDQIIEDRAKKGYAEGVSIALEELGKLEKQFGDLETAANSNQGDAFRTAISTETERVERLTTQLDALNLQLKNSSWFSDIFMKTQGELEAEISVVSRAVGVSTGIIDEYTEAWTKASGVIEEDVIGDGHVHKYLEGTVGWLKEEIKFNEDLIQTMSDPTKIKAIQDENAGFKKQLDLLLNVIKLNKEKVIYIDGSIGKLMEEISVHKQLIKESNDRGFIEKTEEEIKLLEKKIELLKSGTPQASSGIDAPSRGVDLGGGADTDGFAIQIQKQIELLQERADASQNLGEIADLNSKIELYGTLTNAMAEGDFSEFAGKSVVETQNFLKSMQMTNPEMARMVQMFIELSQAAGNYNETAKGLSEEQLMMVDVIVGAIDDLTAIGQGLFERRIQALEEEMDMNEAKYDRQKELIEQEIGDEEAKQVRLEQLEKDRAFKQEQLQKKINKEKTKQAKLDKANALIKIAINTAVWAIEAAATSGGIGGFLTVPLVLAIGGLQAAAVLAQPTPKFKDGHLAGTHEGLAIVNDGGRPEVIERKDGRLEMTNERNRLINMTKGDKVHKSFDSFVNQLPQNDIGGRLQQASILASVRMSNQAIANLKSEKATHESLKGILSGEIKKGFRNVNIRNDNSSIGKAVAQALADDRYTNRFE